MLLLWVPVYDRMKRESGEKPELSRSCKKFPLGNGLCFCHCFFCIRTKREGCRPDFEPEDLPATSLFEAFGEKAANKANLVVRYDFCWIIIFDVFVCITVCGMNKGAVHIIMIMLLGMGNESYAQDSSVLLKSVVIEGIKSKNLFLHPVPSQLLSKKMLDRLNAPTAGDAARYFSGVQVKDYGGAGGLKTVSVRSLGSSQTGILYDGIPVSDVQSGQTDLSRFSTGNLYSIELYNPHPPVLLLPARAFAAASALAMYTPAFHPAVASRNNWQAGLQNGSFGYWQGAASANHILSRQTTIGIAATALTSRGDYPFTVRNGNLSEKTRRNNSTIRSLQGEVNLSKMFKDSSVLQIKGWGYQSMRGLPGAVVFFNDRSEQSLFNNDYFAQVRYQRRLLQHTSLLMSGKFNHSYTRYRDPDFLNNAGGLDDRYRQNELFASIALSHIITKKLSASLASDVARTTLRTEKFNHVPVRTGVWVNGALSYADSLWQVQASLLMSSFSDKTSGGSRLSHVKLTPAFVASRRISAESPVSIRLFHKQVYRMPTFNDLYYNFIGNSRLRPELARQYNLGVTYAAKKKKPVQFSISADGYINRISDKIIAVPSQSLFSWTMLNLGTVDIKGIDITAEANGYIMPQMSWTGRVTYTWQEARDITEPSATTYQHRIPYTPDHSGSLTTSLGFRQWTAGYNLLFSGSRYTLGENNPFNRLDGWTVHDLFVMKNYTLGNLYCTLKAELNNLTNQSYDIIRYYPMPGRTYKISIIIHQ